MKKILILSFVLLLYLNSWCQVTVEGSLVKWYTIEQAMELRKKEMRPLLIDVYTDWCGWCKHMMKTTFASQGIANYINTNFYAVRFNAEGNDSIKFFDTLYVNKGKTHDLAIKLLNKNLSYPTLVYMDRSGNKIPVPGYMTVNQIEPFLVFFSENIGITTSLNEFILNYYFTFPKNYSKEISEIPQKDKVDTTGVINWMSFKKVNEMQKSNPKPYYIYLYVDWCTTCKIMEKTTFGNKIIADYINTNYYPLKLNATSQDSIQAFGQTFKGNGTGQPHQFVMALLQNNLKFPATVIISGNQMLDKEQIYFNAGILESLLVFYAEQNYKTKNFQEFFKTYKSKTKKNY